MTARARPLREAPNRGRGKTGKGNVGAGGTDKVTAAFVHMIKEHDRGLRTLAYRLLRDREVMDDVMQDAYLRAFRAFADFRGESEVRTWLYRIVYNACMDRMRSDSRRREVSLERLHEPGDERAWRGAAAATAYETEWNSACSGQDPAASVVERSELAAALAQLPADQRAVVLLVDAMGFAHHEAAEVLGVRPGTIASRLHYARSGLRAFLAPAPCPQVVRSSLVGGRDNETF